MKILATFLLLLVVFGQSEYSNAADNVGTSDYEYCPRPSELYLSIRRHDTAYLSEKSADAILARATSLVQTKDRKDDVSCGVVFRRSGSVDTFSATSGMIASRSDYRQVLNLPGDVKIVRRILVCNGKPNGTILGCAPIPGRSFVAINMGLHSDNAILWTHEYLHNVGRKHRTGIDLVMNPYHGSMDRIINGAECGALIPYCDMPIPKGTDAVAETIVVAEVSTEEADRDVRSFVKKRYVHGMPYSEAVAFGPADVPILLEVLDNDKDQVNHPNVVSLLGIIGNDPAKEALIQFISQAETKLHNSNTYQATLAAVMSLGYIVNRTGDQDLIAFLRKRVEGLDEPIGNSKEAGQTQAQPLVRLEASDVARAAVWGLALGGTRESRNALRTLAKRTFSHDSKQLIDDAIRAHTTVQQNGLLDFLK